MSGKNSYVRCEHISAQGDQCDEWFQSDGGKYCLKYHRESSLSENKDNFISLMNSQRELCYKMDNIALETHIKEIEAKIEAFVQIERTKLASARAVRAERYEKMTNEERAELRKYQVSKNPNGTKKAATKVDKATQMANKLGVSRADLLTMDMDALLEKFNKAKE